MSIFSGVVAQGYALASGRVASGVLAVANVVADKSETWFHNPAIVEKFWPSVLETIYMTFFSSLFGVLLGLPVGLVLVATGHGGLWSHSKASRITNTVLGVIVNIGRSLPFVILMIAIIPFTRWVVGTTLGWQAAVVPLAISSFPFFARLVESNIQAVSPGKIEAAKMAGASSLQIMFGVQVREAMPMLINSVTVTVITLIGYGAMAGTLGAGGLGALAMNYGYIQFMGDVMAITVVAILVMVQIIQVVGDMLSRLVDHR